MAKSNFCHASRNVAGCGRRRLAASRGIRSASAQQPAAPPLFMDGHVHITNRVYWEKADFVAAAARPAGTMRARARRRRQLHHRQSRHLRRLELQLHAQDASAPDRDGAPLRREAFGQDGDRHHDRAGARRSIAQRPHGGVPRQRIGLGPRGRPRRARRLLPARPAHRSSSRRQTGFNAFADSALAPQQGGQKPDHLPRHQRARPRAGRRDEPARHPDRHHPRHRGGAEADHRGEPAPVVAATTRSRPCRASACPTSAEGARRQGRRGRHPWRRGGGRQALPQMDGASNPDEGEEREQSGAPAWSGYQPSGAARAGRPRRIHRDVRQGVRQRWRALGELEGDAAGSSRCPDRRTNGPSRSTT